MALAHIVTELSRANRLGSVTLVHVDHQLRDDSAADAQVVAELGRSIGAQVVIRKADVDRDRASLEGAARAARYEVLSAVADELHAKLVLLAHTASDQAETVLMRILRGTGVAGLAGIPARAWQVCQTAPGRDARRD